ncbi:MAG: hypothetical protein JNL11_17770 [Bdellovibrionaceae bacterium]|nr:hypothetical protein [Pseudobdellovibrionaceae bacterium]
MSVLFYFWSFILITSISLMGLAIRCLATSGMIFSETLILRGLVCLGLVVVFARVKKLSLVPKSIGTQTIRALVAGMALTAFSLSYNWLSASTVAVISNVDVPMLVILGSLVGQPSSVRAKVLSFISIVFLVLYTLKIQSEPNWILGLGTLLFGLFLLCFGYAFIKKSMNEENQGITILTPALALMAYGLAQKIPDTSVASGWNHQALWVGIVSGIGMFGAYYATMKLYALVDIATAEFPTLLASIVIQPLEWLIFKEPLQVSHFILSIAFVACTYFILNNNKVAPKNEAENDIDSDTNNENVVHV